MQPKRVDRHTIKKIGLVYPSTEHEQAKELVDFCPTDQGNLENVLTKFFELTVDEGPFEIVTPLIDGKSKVSIDLKQTSSTQGPKSEVQPGHFEAVQGQTFGVT
ncbi:hypothetical protein ACFE04_015476 [Oxalis oulophora]